MPGRGRGRGRPGGRRRRGRRGFPVAVVLAVLTAVGAGCAADGSVVAPPVTYDGPPPVYVAVGASEAIGAGADRPLVEAWPQVLYRDNLPPDTVFVSMAVSGSTVAEASRDQLPQALELEPTLVTVWLNVNDLLEGVPVEDYEAQLGALVAGLRREGRARVLVANTPPLDELPAYTAGSGTRFPPADEVVAAVAEYNAAIERVVAREGAALVDLHATGLAARREGTADDLVSGDGFHPSTAGHARVAQAFAAALNGG
jgi:acyl-CoA thioesterase-1